jgi:Tol biopolymer transport system component
LGTERLKLPSSIPGADEAAWSPVNNEIAIEDKIGPDRWAIWVVTPDGKEARKVVEYSSFTYGGLDWSRDGKSIVFAGLSDGKMQLFSVSATGGQPQQLTHDDANLLHPQVSPDGRRIACTRLFETKELWRLRLN